MNTIPPAAFLGYCQKAHQSRLANGVINSSNIFGMSQFISLYVYPWSIKDSNLLFSIYGPALNSIKSFCLKNPDGSQLMKLDIQTFKEADGPPPPEPDHNVEIESPTRIRTDLKFATENNWTTVLLTVPTHILLNSPGTYFWTVLLENEEEIRIGDLHALVKQPTPLTQEKIDSIEAIPNSIKNVHIKLQCNKCSESITAEANLKGEVTIEGAIWYKDIPSRFKCGCGASDYDISYVRENLHGYIGEEAQITAGIMSESQFEKNVLVNIRREFFGVVENSDREEQIHQFIKDHNICLYHPAARTIKSKAPVLGLKVTDFVIHEFTGDLILVELERSNKKIFTKSGTRTSEANQAIEQVTDWMDEIKNNRAAALKSMGIEGPVNKVKGLVVIGRDKDCDPDSLRKLKSTDFGTVEVCTYDDLLKSFDALIDNIKKL